MAPGDDLLVDLVYASLLNEASWQQFLDEITATVSQKAVLLMHGSEADSSYFGVTSGLEEKAVQDYNQYYGARNVLQDALAGRRAGTVLPGESLLPPERLRRTEFYGDYLVPHELTANVGLKITGDSKRSYSLVLCNGFKDEGRITTATSLLRRLSPHLRRAFEFQAGASQADKWSSPFEALGIGAIVLGQRAEVKRISRVAEQMLEHDRPVSISPIGRFTIKEEAAQAALLRMLSRNYGGPKTYDAFHGRLKLTLVAIEKDHITTFFEGPTVLLLMESSGGGGFDPRAIATAYGLTNAEVRALQGIVSGQSVDDIAKRASRSRETIRLQIKSLYAKMGAHSQADVLRLVRFRLSLQ